MAGIWRSSDFIMYGKFEFYDLIFIFITFLIKYIYNLFIRWIKIVNNILLY